MTLALDIPIVDVSAAALGIRFNAPAPELLATLDLQGGEFGLRLSIIGASHVVDVLHGVDEPQLVFREEISCNARAGGQAVAGGVRKNMELPTWQGTQAHGARYIIDVDTHVMEDAELAAHADELATRAEAQPTTSAGWLARRFPGEGEHHLTALHGEITMTNSQAHLQWRTWHVYPEEGAIVESTSTITWPEAPAPNLGGRHV